MLEEYPRVEPAVTAGLPDVTQVVETKDLIALLDQSPAERVDSRAFLRARLFDIWLSDWDRHHEQWDWGRRRSDGRWQAIPKDRDRVFENHNGFLIGMARMAIPHLMDFTREYRKPYAYISNSRDQDRRLLADLDLAAWSQVATELQASLSDEVIAQGLAAMPRAFQHVDNGRINAALKARRDALPRLASDLYRLISDKVDIYATAAPEVTEIQRGADGFVEVRLATLQDRSNPYFRRRFVPDETGEIRIYLNDGNDRVLATGAGSAGPTVRVIGANGRAVLEGPSDGIHFYQPENPRLREESLDENGNRPLDWGSSVSLFPMVDVETDIGLIVGAGVNFQKYGFRAYPFRSRQTLTAETATGDRLALRLRGRVAPHRLAEPHTAERALLRDRTLRFYGFGNEIGPTGSSLFHHVDQRQYLLAPTVRGGARRHQAHASARWPSSRTPTSARSTSSARRARTAATSSARSARRPASTSTPASRGMPPARACGCAPAAAPIRRCGASGRPSARPTATRRCTCRSRSPLAPEPGASASVASGCGGCTRSTRPPTSEARGRCAGISRNRFAGDAYAFGNAELRLRLFKVLGIFGLADVGRVFLATEPSDKWHTAAGGGLWLSFKDDKYVVSRHRAPAARGTRAST